MTGDAPPEIDPEDEGNDVPRRRDRERPVSRRGGRPPRDPKPENAAVEVAGPAVGNVLGFSLLFRERRALLALNRRSLTAGVRLREYEAVIPGVRFPLRGPLNATKFRNRRCRVVSATLAVEDRALLPWLRERLIGQEFLGVELASLELDLRRELPGAQLPRPCLMLGGESRGGGMVWLLVAFDIEPLHRLMVLRPCRLWLVGDLPQQPRGPFGERGGADATIDVGGRDTSARRLWRAIARRLAAGPIAGLRGGVISGEDGSLTVDAGRLAMVRPFAMVGWKAPNLEGCAIETLSLTRRGVTMGLRGPLTEAEPGEEEELGPEVSTPPSRPTASEAAARAVATLPGEPGLLDEPVARALDHARELVREGHGSGGQIGPALELLASLSRELAEFPAAHLALVRWRVDLSRFLDRSACLEAVHEWLDLQPSAGEARRLIAVLLAAEGRVPELARLLAADCRQPHPPLTQARLELAVASLLISGVNQLHDPRSALTIVGPLTQRLREQINRAAGRERRGERRRPGGAPSPGEMATLEGMRELLPEALVVLARARVAEVAREGRSLATAPHVLEALDEALDATTNPRRRADLRAQVAEAFARYGAEHGDDHRGDVQALALLEAAVVDDPDNLELLERAIELALRTDERGTAANFLAARLALERDEREQASLRKRLIAVAAELDDREHRELARRELTLALEHEPDNPVLLRRAAVLERKLGDAQAAADYLGRLLELDEFGEVELDDRDLLLLDRARLLRRAGQIDGAWESLRPGLALVPQHDSQLWSDAKEGGPDEVERRWILDVLELALELAPPTDRPRILDQLITHARGQRRGEALVERAAQSLSIDERLTDLWAAIDELDAPHKILAQIEQLLDDRDFEGLARLASVASQLGEATTELHARTRLGKVLLDEGDPANAVGQLERAIELAPDRLELHRLLAQGHELLDQPERAIPELSLLLRDDREATPDQRGRLSLRLARMFRRVGRVEEAAELLGRCERELSRVNPELVSEEVREAVADQSFAVLRELAEDDRALTVALEHAASLWDQVWDRVWDPTRDKRSEPVAADPEQARRLGAWLARGARVLDEAGVEEVGELSQLLGSTLDLPAGLPRTRVELLARAVALRPEDLALAGGLEAVLRELDDRPGLEAHLRRQIELRSEPHLQAELLERLIEVIEDDDPVEARAAELAELLDDLLVLRPEHTSGLLRLGELRFASGEIAAARQLWAVAGERLEPDDPRFYRPAVELARGALDTGELEQARQLAERACALREAPAEALELLTEIAEELGDLELAARVLRERIELDDADADANAKGSASTREPRQPRQRAALELARATVLARLFERDGHPAAAREAIDHYAAAEALLPARERTQDRSAATRRWLELAIELDDPEAQARARAVLRETLGDDLETAELVAEIELLDGRLHRPLAALERIDWALARREADERLIAALERLVHERGEEFELAARAQRILRAAIHELGPGPGRVRAAELLVTLGRHLDDPAAVAFALDQLPPEQVEVGELAELREWAIRKLGRVQEEIGAVESRLAGGGLEPARRAALIRRLASLLEGDLPMTARRLVELAGHAERETAANLADGTLELVAPVLAGGGVEAARLLELAIECLRSLDRHGTTEQLLARWELVDAAAREAVRSDESRLGLLSQLVELATESEVEALGERADDLLAEQLPRHPDDPRLMRGVWLRSSGEVLLREGERGLATIVTRATAWLELLTTRSELPAATVASLFDNLARLVEEELGADASAQLLRERAEFHVDEPELFAALLDRLERRRRWPELLSLFARATEAGTGAWNEHAEPSTWLAVAEAAAEDGDIASEVVAREQAGELLARRAKLRGEIHPDDPSTRQVDEALAEQAIEQLGRALELDPERAGLRWRLGLALTRLGRIRAAFDHLVAIWDREQWSDAGVELGELALHVGELAGELGEHERAVELLSAAHARAGEEWREYATGGLFDALLQVGRRDEAIHLASARASELVGGQGDVTGGVRWLRQAAKLAAGARKVELLERARELAPEDDTLLDELEAELRELGDYEAIEALLRERIDGCRAAAEGVEDRGELDRPLRDSWLASLDALIALLEHARAEALDDQARARDEADDPESARRQREDERRQGELVALYRELLTLSPDHTEALMIVAADHHRLGRSAEALELWARAEPRLGDEDPRLFEVCRRLAERELAGPEPSPEALAEANRLLERALGQRPDEVEVLERRHEIACALDDAPLVLTAARALLTVTEAVEPGPSQRRAELESDVARALLLIDPPEPLAALEALERAVSLAEDGSELHRQLVRRWLELIEDAGAQDLLEPVELELRELAARAELRRALGAELSRDESLRELDLLIELGEREGAHELLELMLIAEPQAQDLRARLRAMGEAELQASAEGETAVTGLRTLRRVVDAIAPGPIRDDLARELAHAARRAESARITLDALDRLSGEIAAEAEMLDLRVWAVRKLDRVEDELAELDQRLIESSRTKAPETGADAVGDGVLLERLQRVLEHDLRACAERLIDLAEHPEASPPTRVWLLESALQLLSQRGAEWVELAVRALARLVELLADPRVIVELEPDEQGARERIAGTRRIWQQLAASALSQAGRDRRALGLVTELISVAEAAAQAELPGFADLGEMLIDRATVDFPDHAPLHVLARRRVGDDPGAALERLELLARTHRMDARGRARLYLGLAATLSDDPPGPDAAESGSYPVVTGLTRRRSPRRKFLRDLAGYHSGEPAIFGPLREALRQLDAFDELLAVLHGVEAAPEQWLELAEDAGAAGRTDAEAEARRRAGFGLFERVLAEEREGGGLSDTSLARAIAQLARAHELAPEDARTRYHYGRALERAGRAREALDMLALLIEPALASEEPGEVGVPVSETTVGKLARRCGLLALELDEHERAATLLRLAYDTLANPRPRLAVAERLFDLLQELVSGAESEEQRAPMAERATALARETARLAEQTLLGEGELRGGRGGAQRRLEVLPWLERAARLAADEGERAELYARAHELAPDDERLADAYEASLRDLDDRPRLEALLRRRIAAGLDSGDRARTVAQLERLLGLLPALEQLSESPADHEGEASEDPRKPIRDRAQLLEQLLRLAPDRLEARLELASLRILEGDREAASAHWRQLAQRLPSGDRRFLEPARALARFALDSGELEQARRWLERARAIEPARETLASLLEVARGLDEPQLVLSTSAALLEDADPGDEPGLLRERAQALERLDRPDEALDEIRKAAAASEVGSDDHVEAARHWLRLATRDGMRVLLREDEALSQAEGEAEARAELRRALGDRLPARAYIAEAELLAVRLDRRDEAIELLLHALTLHPGEADLLASFEELCTGGGEQARFVRSLAELLPTVDVEDEATAVRLGEKLARAARAIDDPRTCLDALEGLPDEVAERSEMLELRDWAVRGIGTVDDELDRLDARFLALEPGSSAERAQALVSRMLRLLGDAGEPSARRLLALAEGDETPPELGRVLARTALRVAREYAPENLSVAVDALEATLARDSVKAVAAWWGGIETLALESSQLDPILALLALAIDAERDPDSGYASRADRLAQAAARLSPDEAELHDRLTTRASLAVLGASEADAAATPATLEQLDPILDRIFAHVDALARGLGLGGTSLARLWSGALAAIERRFGPGSAGAGLAETEATSTSHGDHLNQRIAAALRERVEAALDRPETFTALLELLRARACWPLVLELLLRADQRRSDLEPATLGELAREAGRSGDRDTRLRARVEQSRRLESVQDYAGAAEALSDALSVADADRVDLQYRLGDLLARAGRADAALEQLLPLVERDDLEELGESLGIDQRAWNLRLDNIAVARRCAGLLIQVDARARGAELLGRAFGWTRADDPRRMPIAEALFEVRVALEDEQGAAELAATVAAETRDEPEQRLEWLLRVADHGDEKRRVEALTDAHALRPSDELAARLERALEALGADERLEALLRTKIEQARVALASSHASESMREAARERGFEALRKLIVLRRERRQEADEADPQERPRSDRTGGGSPTALPAGGGQPNGRHENQELEASLAPLWEQALLFRPEDIDSLLALASAYHRGERRKEAAGLWRRAHELLPAEDDRLFVPVQRLAELARAEGDHQRARELLDQALAIRPGDHDVLDALRSLAIETGDPALRIRAIEGLLDHPEHAEQRAELELEAARAHASLREEGENDETLRAAIAAFERAASAAEAGSDLQREITRAWLELVATDSASLLGTDTAGDERKLSGEEREALRLAREREAAARAQLRAAHLGVLGASELRIEASLLALGLGRVDEGLSLVETALLAEPDDPLLLSAFKDLCLATGAQARYADALDAAIGVLPEGEVEGGAEFDEARDRLATELAFTAVELEDAPRLLEQLERMSAERASSPELLDLREWAIRKLGRVEDELTEIDEELLASRTSEETAVLVDRLLRMLDQDPDETGRRLVMLAGRAEPEVAVHLRDSTLELARVAPPSYFDVLLNTLEQILAEHEDGEPPTSVAEHWPSIEKLALERDDPGLLAMLLDLGYRARDAGLSSLDTRVAELTDLALTRHPDSAELHALILGPLEVELSELDRDPRLSRADEALAGLAGRLGLQGRKRARLWVGFAKLFDRRDGAALLARRARAELFDNQMFLGLIDALEDNNHWTRSLELLEYRVARDEDQVRKVADLKRLAHLCADILGDPDAAIGHLERALESAPEDPDLMLPLLDHYYAQPQLDRAIELSSRVLELVPMGAVAFAALGHRAADAALATGEHQLAEKLLRTILARIPDDSRTRDRLRELEQLADDPEHRARMLAAIANRTTGSARVEALEERARLLVEPLARLEEAIADLEAVCAEAPGRHAAVRLLADLYEQRQRWRALVTLLEREYPRQHGLDRVLTLERIATIQRDRLDDLPRAEKALRLALENLEGLEPQRVATELSRRPELATVLELGAGERAREPEHEPDEIDTDALFESIVLPQVTTRAKDERDDDPAPAPGAQQASEARPEVSLAEAERATARLGDRLHLELVTCLERRGRFSELIGHLETELADELSGTIDPRERFAGGSRADADTRLTLMQRLARALRDHVEDGERTARVYARLEQLDALPDEGLATLARWYRGQQRYDDLVRILTVRSRKLGELGDWDRKAEADFRIGELLEGPLRRPHEAARFFLDAYLANPLDNPHAGMRARVLLAGTDSVVNVRNRLLMRLQDLPEDYQPSLLTLLADLLSPHDDHEDESERRYREALEINPDFAGALEGLGRLLSRQGRLAEAVEPLTKAAQSPDIPNDRAADDAASAARALVELDRADEAEAVLAAALERADDSQRALLELARLYNRLERRDDEARTLERLATLPLSSSLRAEVGYRQAMLLADEFRADPMSEGGERARALLLEAVGADAMHAQARQALLELAGARSEWSIVAHMHFLAIRELPPGPRRALTHLDLAETYLDRLSDAQSSVRNLGAALQQAPTDVVVVNRANAIAGRLPNPGEAAERLEQFARGGGRPELGETLDDKARARLLIVASDLHLRNDTLEPAEAAAREATALRELDDELRALAESHLEQIVQIDQGEFDLRKRRKSLHNKLEATEDPVDRLRVFSRLRETARALNDHADLEETTRRQLELAHELLAEAGGDDRAEVREAALSALRNVFAESGDYARVVQLYEDLAGRTGNADEAAELLTSAARFAWSGLRDPKLAVAIVRRALDRSPTHAPATTLLGEIAGASDEREVDATICDELSQLAPRQRAPLLTLRLAEAALRLERREQAQGVLRQLLAGEAPIELRVQALGLLDGLLESAGRTHDRIPLLEERLELCRRHWPDRAADVALQLARAQRAVGNLQDARATCRTALLDKPSDQPLTRLYAELLEQAEDWSALARALEQLANLTIETREQAHWLTKAAQVHLDHGAESRESLVAARRLLERARAVSMESTETRAVLLPLTFHQADWERVLELAVELRSIAGDEHEALIYAALTEAFARGKRTLARSIGDRHERELRQQILWPACARMLQIIASEGPLPRLDALLSAAAALCGGTEELLDELGAWAAGQPLQAGLALGLARLNEAFRRMELARHLYQISAFMAPSGPVPVLTTRLPPLELPRAPMQEGSWVPLEWRGALREVLLELRDSLSGIRGRGGTSHPARSPKERLAVQHATRIAGPWRTLLGFEFNIAISDEPIAAGIGVRNLSKPTIVVTEVLVDVQEAERRYRLAYAAAALATGVAIVLDDAPIALPDLLDALTSLVKPRHEPSTEAARSLVDTLASRGLTASRLNVDLRRALARELDHWRGSPAKLERVLHRSCMLIAARLSGSVDGALTAMARDRGLTAGDRPGDPAVLETSDAAWLLRALGVFGGHG